MNLFEGWFVMLVAFGVFAGTYILNIVFGAIENCVIDGELFEWGKLRNSILRILMSGIFTCALLVGFNAFSLIPEAFGVNISELFKSGITLGAFVLLYAKGYLKLAIDVYEKIRGWFGYSEDKNFDIPKPQTTVNKEDMQIEGSVENEY